MAGTGEEPAHEIREDLACPACEYNLRGLYGQMVQCPECGATCDVTALRKPRWTKPWYRAPGLTTVMLPASWTILWLFGMCFGAALDAWKPLGYVLVWMVIWWWLLWRARLLFQSVEGLYLALAAHLVMAGYMLGFGGIAVAIIFVAKPGGSLYGAKLLLALFPTAAVVSWMWACHRLHHAIAERCIRRYLGRSPQS